MCVCVFVWLFCLFKLLIGAITEDVIKLNIEEINLIVDPVYRSFACSQFILIYIESNAYMYM